MNLTTQQNIAINTIANSVSVEAGAGSGKTTVIINRSLKILGNDYSNISRLLIITFTDKASQELKSRLRTHIPNKYRYKLENAWIGTFHFCFARIIRQHAPVLSIDPLFNIMDENTAEIVSSECIRTIFDELISTQDESALLLIDKLDYKTSVLIFEELMRYRWHAQKVLQRGEANEGRDQELTKALLHIFSLIQDSFDAHLRQQSSLDFQSLETMVLKLFEANKDILLSYQKKFEHILVDEFQDTNDLQTEIVTKIINPRYNKICIVGDPRQSIYRFRGANPTCFKNVQDLIKKHGGTTISLSHNFRSKKGIVDFVNTFQAGVIPDIASNDSALVPTRDNTASPPLIAIQVNVDPQESAFLRRHAEADCLAKYIANSRAAGDFKIGDVACLFRTLNDASIYESAFRRYNLPYRFYGSRGLLERQEITDLLFVLNWAAHPNDYISFLGILRSPFVGLSDNEIVILAGPDGKGLPKIIPTHPKLKLLREIQSLSAYLRPSELIRHVIESTGYELVLDKLDRTGGISSNLEHFVSLIKSIERSEQIALVDFSHFLKELKELSARLGDAPSQADSIDAIKCMTVHAAKGLEFPVVILPELFRAQPSVRGNFLFLRQEGLAFKQKNALLPFSKKEDTPYYTELKQKEESELMQESKRLLYVAMTRAQEKLVIPIHKEIKRNAPWHLWLSEIAGGSSNIQVINSDSITKATAINRISSETKKGILARSNLAQKKQIYTVSELECFQRCPMEYKLKYVRNIPSSKITLEAESFIPANIFGLIAHKILEEYDLSKTPNIDEIIRIKGLENNVVLNGESVKQLRVLLEFVKESPILRKYKVIGRELDFNWLTSNVRITGTIDYLIETEDGALQIVDFKTDNVTESEAPAHSSYYELQLVCYALAAKAATGKAVGSTSLIYLKPNYTHTVVFDEIREDRGRQDIESVVTAINEMDFAPTKLKKTCITCPYHHNKVCWEDNCLKI